MSCRFRWSLVFLWYCLFAVGTAFGFMFRYNLDMEILYQSASFRTVMLPHDIFGVSNNLSQVSSGINAKSISSRCSVCDAAALFPSQVEQLQIKSLLSGTQNPRCVPKDLFRLLPSFVIAMALSMHYAIYTIYDKTPGSHSWIGVLLALRVRGTNSGTGMFFNNISIFARTSFIFSAFHFYVWQ